MPSSDTTVQRLRVHAPGAHSTEALRAQRAVRRWLDELAPAHFGLPAQAIVVVRHLKTGLPALLPGSPWPDPLAALLRSAARPATQPAVGAAATAVWFADEAELLACLARDALAARCAWWWPLLLGRQPDPAAAAARWCRAPTQLPRALLQLSADDGAAWMQALGRTVRADLLLALRSAFVVCEPVQAWVAAADSPPTAQRPGGGGEGDGAAPASGAPASDGHAPARRLQRLLQALAVDAMAAATPGHAAVWCPAMAGSGGAPRPAVAHAARPYTAAARRVPGAPSPSGRAPAAQLPAPAAAPPTLDGAPASRQARLVTAAGPFRKAATDDGAARPADAAAADRHRAASPARAPGRVSASRHPHATPAAAGEAPPPGLARTPAGAASAPTPVGAPACPAPGGFTAETPTGSGAAPPATHARNPVGVATSPADEASFDTQFGGLFYMLNLALAMGLYGDFTQPLTPGLAHTPWQFLHALGGRWAGRAYRDDALSRWLQGRADEHPWPARHGSGGVDAAVRQRRTGPDRLAALAPRLARRLAGALGQARPGAAVALALRLPAQVRATPGRLDLHFELATLPLSLRLAGLDRDPGWVPAAGCDFRFHFH